MFKTTIIKSIVVGSLLFTPVAIWACDAAGASTHIGTVTAVDAKNMTFTITDAQTRGPITFRANNEIIDGLKDAKGSVMVSYEEVEGSKDLKALGVTF